MFLNFRNIGKYFFIGLGVLVFVSLASVNSYSQNRDAVVKVFVTSNSVDYYHPWQSKGSSSSSGSGCVIEGNRILTNAHVVWDETFIQVRKESDPKKYTAHVEAIGNDCDLAILRVDDETFFKGISPLAFGELPNLQAKVTALGFPAGGDKLSVTEGVVSRVELIRYAQSSQSLLAVQIDAAINPGNSGGPIILDDKIVGVAMQVLNNGQNISYMIPTPIIHHFLDDLKLDGIYNGFPILGIEYENTENPALRNHFLTDKESGGVLITRVAPYSAAEGILQEGDVVLEVNNIPVAMDGTINFRANERLEFSYLIQQNQIGNKVELTVINQGRIVKKQMLLKEFIPLVPYLSASNHPPYYIFGGVVFTVLSLDLLKSWGDEWWRKAPLNFLDFLIGKGRLNLDRKKEIVVMLDVFPDDVNVGYLNYSDSVIEQVNGKTFKSFQEFVTLVESNPKEYLTLKTDQELKIIIDQKLARMRIKDVLERNNIKAQYSPEVSSWIQEDNIKGNLP